MSDEQFNKFTSYIDMKFGEVNERLDEHDKLFRDIYSTLDHLVGGVDDMSVETHAVSIANTDMVKRIDDHEDRIKKLEFARA